MTKDLNAIDLKVHIRWMIRADLERVVIIEHDSFEFPWSQSDFVQAMRERNTIGMVAEHGQRVVGYMVYDLLKTQIHLQNIAVDPKYRRRNVGGQMVDKLLSKLSPERRDRIKLEVRETNMRAQLFFKSQGFRATSVLHDFYDDTHEDAYCFVRNL